MSMGFPDRIGPRAGFSYPYFPYCLDEDRPYDVVEISLFLMDVTLRSYMGLKGRASHGMPWRPPWTTCAESGDASRRCGIRSCSAARATPAMIASSGT